MLIGRVPGTTHVGVADLIFKKTFLVKIASQYAFIPFRGSMRDLDFKLTGVRVQIVKFK